jgi:hypothetical protein
MSISSKHLKKYLACSIEAILLTNSRIQRVYLIFTKLGLLAAFTILSAMQLFPSSSLCICFVNYQFVLCLLSVFPLGTTSAAARLAAGESPLFF